MNKNIKSTASGHKMAVKVFAESIQLADGVVELYLPVRELDANEMKVLEMLFPHTSGLIDKALATEALMASLVE